MRLKFISRSWQLLLKVAVSILFVVLLYYQIRQPSDLIEYPNVQEILHAPNFFLKFLLILILMPFNWILEAYKWHRLLVLNFKIKFFNSFKSILSGVLFSMFTPNRIGQFVGRLWYLTPDQSFRGVYATLVGSFAQNLIHLFFGILGLGLIVIHINIPFHGISIGVLLWFFAISAILIVAYFNLNFLINKLKTVSFFRGHKQLEKIKWSFPIPMIELLKVLGISFVRFLVFSTQYYLVILLVGIEVPFVVNTACIATIFLFQTFIPLPPVIGFIARGEIAVLVWQPFDVEVSLVLIATYTLWLINIVLPSIIGLLFFIFATYKNRTA